MRAAAEKWAPWAAGLVLLAGAASFTATRLAGSSPPAPAGSAQLAVPLDPAARAVAKEFVATAVARRHLDRAWALAAPALRGDLTRAEWGTGNIPIQPYPVGEATVAWAVEQSFADSALLRLSFLPRQGARVQPGDFTLGLTRIAGRWRVASYAPSATITPSQGG